MSVQVPSGFKQIGAGANGDHLQLKGHLPLHLLQSAKLYQAVWADEGHPFQVKKDGPPTEGVRFFAELFMLNCEPVQLIVEFGPDHWRLLQNGEVQGTVLTPGDWVEWNTAGGRS